MMEDLKAHVINVHKAKLNRKHLCTSCGKEFTQKSHLKNHMMIHSNERPIQCPSCSMCFRTKSNFKKHFITHTGLKKFSCQYCEKLFSRNDHLKVHMYKHHSVNLADDSMTTLAGEKDVDIACSMD